LGTGSIETTLQKIASVERGHPFNLQNSINKYFNQTEYGYGEAIKRKGDSVDDLNTLPFPPFFTKNDNASKIQAVEKLSVCHPELVSGSLTS
jgi:hypothetical protein